MATLRLEVVTPDATVLSEDVEMVMCPGEAGEFGVLPHHVSLLSALKIGPLRYQKNGVFNVLFISGGFADINNNVCSVLAVSAEKAENIDKARAEKAKKRAQERLQRKTEDIDEIRAEAALKRALMRLHISEMR